MAGETSEGSILEEGMRTKSQQEAIMECKKLLKAAFGTYKGSIEFHLRPDKPNADQVSIRYVENA